MRCKLIFLSVLLLCSVAYAQLAPDTVAMLDKVLNRYQDNAPGAQVAISRHGQLIYSSVKGMADLEHMVPLTRTSKTEAGSVSKQFTAAAILILQQQGKLSLDDDVRKYLPELPDYGNKITIRHLMQHTSGLKDWGSIAEISGWPRGTKAYTNDDALKIISLQKSLNNKPGDEYIYSNSGYTSLVHIIQRVSGMSHAAFTKKFIFEPAGMTHTEWRDDYRRVVPGRAVAYSRSGGSYVMNMPFENTYGHGGLLTTAEDLLAWNNYYLSGKLGGREFLQKQLATTPLNNGKKNSYAAGLVTDSVRGWAAIAHSGATAAYRANIEYFPELGLSVAWLSNNAQADLSDIPAAIRNIFVPSRLPVARNSNSAVANIDIRDFAAFTGTYREARTGTGFRLFLQDTILMSTPNGKLVPLSSNTAAAGRAKLIFAKAPRSLVFITASGDSLFYAGVDTARASVTFNEYAGNYASEETESKMNVLMKEGKLYTSVRGQEILLNPVYKDGFSFPGGDLIFERDKKGKVHKMFISISRARRVEFSRISTK